MPVPIFIGKNESPCSLLQGKTKKSKKKYPVCYASTPFKKGEFKKLSLENSPFLKGVATEG
jgi:hypothetical protein